MIILTLCCFIKFKEFRVLNKKKKFKIVIVSSDMKLRDFGIGEIRFFFDFEVVIIQLDLQVKICKSTITFGPEINN